MEATDPDLTAVIKSVELDDKGHPPPFVLGVRSVA
jgi:hypothetical protein